MKVTVESKNSDFLKDWKMPTEKEFIENYCKITNPNGKHKCETCGSKHVFWSPDAGPIVGGVGDCCHPPNAHHIGKWVCFDCLKKDPFTKACLEYDREKETLQDILKCSKCGKPLKKIDEHTYVFVCSCSPKKLRISVG